MFTHSPATDTSSWFESWFDSPYYPLLYSNRDESEAERFISLICDHIDLPKGASVLDLACGRGRHSVTFSKLGYQVLGVDLSPSAIETASLKQSDQLYFRIHDIRNPLPETDFDLVVNLFTSFGYFENPLDDKLAMSNAFKALKKRGIFIFDYLNVGPTISQLIQDEVVTRGGVAFHIHRSVEGGFIQKSIDFDDHGKHYSFVERVRAYGHEELLGLIRGAGFDIRSIFGNYDLQSFEAQHSDRVIIIAQKMIF